jgi:hypothetical protein
MYTDPSGAAAKYCGGESGAAYSVIRTFDGSNVDGVGLIAGAGVGDALALGMGVFTAGGPAGGSAGGKVPPFPDEQAASALTNEVRRIARRTIDRLPEDGTDDVLMPIRNCSKARAYKRFNGFRKATSRSSSSASDATV